MRGWWLAGALALGAGCSPYGGGSFACTDNAQCSPNGTCASGFCAFPDPDCPSMLKYGEASGPNSGKCVGATGVDGGADGPVDADNTPLPDGAVCYGNSLVRACFASAPTGTKTVNAAINTMTSSQCATLVGANATAWCVIAGSAVTVTGTVAVTGNRPLVLLSTGTIDVNGTLDVASHRGGTQGPDSDVTGCNAGTAPTGTSGGAGGSLGGTGAAGIGAGGAGGAAGAKLTPTTLRGGCPGQKGAGGGGGNGGHGGGAVWLYATTSITIGGNIDASGSSGDGGANASSSGGGGGASGGYVGLEAPSVTVTGSIFANGGGGGEGSGPASSGNPGTDSPNVTTAAAGGGGGSFSGTDGGDGSLGTTLDGSPGTGCGGCASGGGGGGGAGIIKVVPSQTTGGQLSPPAS